MGEGGFCVNVWLEEEPLPGPADVPEGHGHGLSALFFALAGTLRPRAGVIQVESNVVRCRQGAGGRRGHNPPSPSSGGGERTVKPKP